jgi:hypothetical protein
MVSWLAVDAFPGKSGALPSAAGKRPGASSEQVQQPVFQRGDQQHEQ